MSAEWSAAILREPVLSPISTAPSRAFWPAGRVSVCQRTLALSAWVLGKSRGEQLAFGLIRVKCLQLAVEDDGGISMVACGVPLKTNPCNKTP